MDFDFTDEQKAFTEAARGLFAGECTAADLRAMWGDDSGRSPQRWRTMAETGLLAVLVPEEHGGLGLDEVSLVGLVQEAGYVALPEPLAVTAGVAVPLLLEAGTREQQAAWLPRVAAGDAVISVQLQGQTTVSDAHVADLLLQQRGDELHAVPAEGVRITSQPSMDHARRLFTVEADTSSGTRMAGGADVAGRALDRGATFTAAFCNGLGQRLLDMTVAHVSEREQFGRPVGSFQAVKHKLAETLLEVETSKPAAWYAAYAIAHDLPDRAVAASVAKSCAAGAVDKAQDEALQCHGGIGFTWEHDLHLYLKRAIALQGDYGTPSWHRQRLADHVLAAAG